MDLGNYVYVEGSGFARVVSIEDTKILVTFNISHPMNKFKGYRYLTESEVQSLYIVEDPNEYKIYPGVGIILKNNFVRGSAFTKSRVQGVYGIVTKINPFWKRFDLYVPALDRNKENVGVSHFTQIEFTEAEIIFEDAFQSAHNYYDPFSLGSRVEIIVRSGSNYNEIPQTGTIRGLPLFSETLGYTAEVVFDGNTHRTLVNMEEITISLCEVQGFAAGQILRSMKPLSIPDLRHIGHIRVDTMFDYGVGMTQVETGQHLRIRQTHLRGVLGYTVEFLDTELSSYYHFIYPNRINNFIIVDEV